MSANNKSSTRRVDLDWLRVLAILTVFFYHSTRFFNLGDWHVKNPTTYFSVEVWNEFATVWMMPLIFAISGASLFFALNRPGFGRFFKDKVLRLFVPLAVGALTHISLQVYLERVSHGQFQGSYFEFLPHYFDGLYMDVGEGGNFAWQGLHLWYLLILFLYSLLLYPLFRWLKGAGVGNRVLRAVGDFLARPGLAFLLILPLALLDALISDTGLEEVGAGGWAMLMYLPFLIGGFWIASHEGLQESIRRQRLPALVIGLLAMAGYLVVSRLAGRPVYDWLEDAFGDLLRNTGAWSLLLAILGYGRQLLNLRSPLLDYANEAVLPFYILHQTVLIVAGYFITRLAIPDLLKWALIFTLSFALIMGIYEYGVRRVPLLRRLFGMKPLAPRPEPRPVAAD